MYVCGQKYVCIDLHMFEKMCVCVPYLCVAFVVIKYDQIIKSYARKTNRVIESPLHVGTVNAVSSHAPKFSSNIFRPASPIRYLKTTNKWYLCISIGLQICFKNVCVDG